MDIKHFQQLRREEKEQDWKTDIGVPVVFCPRCHHDFRPQPGSGTTKEVKGKTFFECYYLCANESCKHGVWLSFEIEVRFSPLWPHPMQFRMVDTFTPVDDELGGPMKCLGDDIFEDYSDDWLDPTIYLKSE